MIFKSYFNRPPTEPEAEHSHIYKWTYVDDETGEIITQQKNQVSVIQSVVVMTPADMVNNGIGGYDNVNANYGDVTTVPTDIVGIMDYISSLQADLDAYKAQKSGKTDKEATTASAEAATAGAEADEPAKGVNKDE